MVFYLIGFFLLFIDSASLSLMHGSITHAVLWFYIANLLSAGMSVPRLCFLWILLSVQAYLQWSTPLIELTYLIPITSIGYFLRPRVHHSWIIPTALCLLTLFAETFPLEFLMIGWQASLQNFTMRKIFTNLVLIFVITFLTYRRGKLGNRS